MIFASNDAIKILINYLQQLKTLELNPVIGVEVEFYLLGNDRNQSLDLDFDIVPEDGENQFEIRFAHTSDILALINQIKRQKQIIYEQAAKQKLVADFGAKPFKERPGSALHVHLHLENNAKANLFIKETNTESKFMKQSIAGLCATTQENMLLFSPNSPAYARYIEPALNSPSKICWGNNNRSAAIRIPLSENKNRRLEHRISSADSEPIEVIIGILSGVLKGLKENLILPKKLHGNAFLEQYDYPLLTQNFAEAKADFLRLSPLAQYISNMDV